MADILTTPVDCEFFVKTDPYNYAVDNRPLGNLLNNDLLINAELENVRDEVHQARTGLVTTYGTLDLRLDALEGDIGATVSVDDMNAVQNLQYAQFLSLAESLRRASPSGVLDFGGIADLAVGDPYDDFAAIRTTNQLGVGYENSIVLWTGWGSYYKPARALVNGWIVRMFNEKLGSPGTTPANHVTLELGSAPASGKNTNLVFLEVWLARVDKDTPLFYEYGSVTANTGPTVNDPMDPTVIHTVTSMVAGGDWIQVRHRFRLIADIDIATYPDAMTDPQVLGRGGSGSPVGGYFFTNMADVIDDAGLWRTGDGSGGSQSDLSSYDGYVYAIPIAAVHRRNSGNFTISNQNGTRIVGNATSGYLASALSGHPAQLYYDAIAPRDILDLRTKVSLSGTDVKSELDRSWQMLIRGELRTTWGELLYDYDNNGSYESGNVWGHTLTVVDEISNSAEALTNPLRDFAVTGAPVALPDGQRNVWSKNATIQYVKFSFTQGTNVSAAPSGFVTYDSSTETLTFNAATLSGNGTGGTKIGSTPPVIMKLSNLLSKPATSASGLGTQVSTAKMTGLTAAAQYVGYIPVVYPGGSGVTYPQRTILANEVIDNAVTRYGDEQFGTGSPSTSTLASPHGVARDQTGNYYYVADRSNHRVVKINPATWAIVAQFGVTGTAAADNTHLNLPTGICVDTTGNIYIGDSGNHRVVKLTNAMVYSAQFGITGTSGADNTHLNSPAYVATDNTSVFITDTRNHRLLKIPVSMGAPTGQFGVTGVVGANKSGLSSPTGVAVVTAGFGTGIWVCDHNNNRIVVLDASLTFQYQICDQTNRNVMAIPHVRMVKQYTVDSAVCYFVLIADGPDGSVLYKFNANFALVGRFGVPGQPGDDTTHLNFPSGFVYDAVNGWLYIADSANHRLIRIDPITMTYLTQYGVTGVTQAGISRPLSVICPTPIDVDVDTSGNVFVSCNEVHVIKKLNSSLAQTAIFGTWAIPDTATGTTGLRNPLGVACKPDGSVVWVVDANNKRIVRLNGSLVYQGYFTPQYTTAALPRVVSGAVPGGQLSDINYYLDVGTPSDSGWYTCVREAYLGDNTGMSEFTTLRFPDTPTNTVGTANYTQRIVSPVPYHTSAFATSASIFTGSVDVGVVIYNRTSPSSYEFTKDSTNTIFFRFNDLMGLSSDGTRVLVSEPSVNAVHCFDADIGLYRGSAGIIYEAGTDKSHLNGPAQAIIHSKYLVIVDTNNHRLLRRHQASPWVSKDGTITTMLPPVGADKVRLYYDIESYQGVLRYFDGAESIFKSQVKAESGNLYATTMGLGAPLTATYSDFFHLNGMTFRLPMPAGGWTDYSVSPIGMKTGTADLDDDTPYLVAPISTTEGFLGGQGVSNDQFLAGLQEIVRTVSTPQPGYRGYRSIIAADQTKPRKRLIATELLSGGQRIIGSPTLPPPPRLQVETFFEILRLGVPPVRSANLLEAVPHITYYPFLYQRNGVLLMGVIAEGSNAKNVSIGSVRFNSVDSFYPFGRTLIRG